MWVIGTEIERTERREPSTKTDPRSAPVRRHVPDRCRRSPNVRHDGAFAVDICLEGDTRCYFRGPAYLLDARGREYECRAREEEA